MSLREKQQAKKAAKEQSVKEFTKASGLQNPLISWDEHIEKVKFELLRMKKQQEKMN